MAVSRVAMEFAKSLSKGLAETRTETPEAGARSECQTRPHIEVKRGDKGPQEKKGSKGKAKVT